MASRLALVPIFMCFCIFPSLEISRLAQQFIDNYRQVEQLPPAQPEQPDDPEPEPPFPAEREEKDDICFWRSSLPQVGQNGRSPPSSRNSNSRPQDRQMKSKSGIILNFKIFHTSHCTVPGKKLRGGRHEITWPLMPIYLRPLMPLGITLAK
jgi:hypothetical protein